MSSISNLIKGMVMVPKEEFCQLYLKDYSVDLAKLLKLYNPKGNMAKWNFINDISSSKKSVTIANNFLNKYLELHVKTNEQECFELLTVLMRSHSIDEIYENVNDESKLPTFMCNAFNYRITTLYDHCSSMFDIPYLLFHCGYTDFKDFINDYGKTIFDAMCSNRAYQRKNIDYSKIQEDGFEKFMEIYFDLKNNASYREVVSTFDSMIYCLLNCYTKEELHEKKDNVKRRIGSGFLSHQMHGNVECLPIGKLTSVIDDILPHLDNDTLSLIIGCKKTIYDRFTVSPLSLYTNRLYFLINHPGNLDEEDVKRLNEIASVFNKIVDYVSCGQFDSLLKYIEMIDEKAKETSQENESEPTFNELVKKSIIDYQRISRKAIICNANRFPLEEAKNRIINSSDKNISAFIKNSILVTDYKGIKDTLFRRVSFDDFDISTETYNFIFLLDAFRMVGEDYLNGISPHTKEETKENLFRIASLIFGGVDNEENMAYLHSIIEEDVFNKCIINAEERKIVCSPVSLPSSEVCISPELYEFIEKETDNFTKPLCELAGKELIGNNLQSFNDAFKNLLDNNRYSTYPIPINSVDSTSDTEYKRTFNDLCTLAFAVDTSNLDENNLYVISDDPFIDDNGIAFALPFGVVNVNDFSRQNYPLLSINSDFVKNSALLLFHPAIIDEDVLEIMKKANRIADELNIPIILVNNDAVMSDMRYLRKQAEESLNGSNSPENSIDKRMVMERHEKPKTGKDGESQ